MQRVTREYARSLRQHRRWLVRMRPRCWLCPGDKLAKRPSPGQRRTLAAGRDEWAQLEGGSPA